MKSIRAYCKNCGEVVYITFVKTEQYIAYQYQCAACNDEKYWKAFAGIDYDKK